MTQTSTPAPARITFEASWSPTDGEVVLVREERGVLAGPIAGYPATSRVEALQAMRARCYTPVGDWYVDTSGNHAIALVQTV